MSSWRGLWSFAPSSSSPQCTCRIHLPIVSRPSSPIDIQRADQVDGRQRPNGNRNTWANPMGAAVSQRPRKIGTPCVSILILSLGLRPVAHHRSVSGQEQPSFATYRRTVSGAQLPPSSIRKTLPNLLLDTYHRMDRWCLRSRVRGSHRFCSWFR